MSSGYDGVTGLVEALVVALVDDEEGVEVSGHGGDEGYVIEITVNPDETGKIIGRQGRMIKAIRMLARAACDGPLEVEVLG
jgi:predicted RNA-binding protein YlqC (UPF0109 family)